MKPHFYATDGDLFHPTHLARSPWEKGKQNGVGMGGLAAVLAEGVPAPAAMETARLTIDILGAAPHAATEGRTRIVREGRRLQMVECDLLVAGRVVARASVLRTRTERTPVFGEAPAYPPPDSVPECRYMDERAFGGAMETRIVRGVLGEPGPKALWVRFGHEHVAGVPLSPLVRAASLADFGGGLGSMLDRRLWTSANLDITLHMVRKPEGEWLLCDASTWSDGRGHARSDMVIADERGAFARAHQILFVAPAAR